MAAPSDYPLIDTHAHLDHSQFAQDLDQVLERAAAAGVSQMLTVGCDLESSRRSVALARRFAQLYAAVGIHPHDAPQADAAGLEALRRLLASEPKVVAIGEIGLDYYRDRAPRPVQLQAFRDQIALAREVGLPLIVHDRDAHTDVLQILRESGAREVGGVLHCFSGDLDMAKAVLDLGFYLSFPATITYPGNSAGREVVKGVPIESMLIETDCPYLAPQSQRGRRNEPAYVPQTAAMIAQIKGLSPADVARITTLNAWQLFGLGSADTRGKIAYSIRNSLYLNLTNRCTNTCTFCPKFKDFTVKGHQLRLPHEPSAFEVLQAIGDPRRYDEVVFCGYGEPLLRLELIKEVAAHLKTLGMKTRINTDGQANLVHGRNILPELAGLIDAVSVSLNAADAQTYQSLCNSRYGAEGFAAVLEFLRQAPAHIPSVTATAVALPGLDIDACRQLAAEIGVEFRARDYNEVG
jgi:TatD DNase family protein